jgi:ribosomal protein S18 acetylase RimI-like enzyme
MRKEPAVPLLDDLRIRSATVEDAHVVAELHADSWRRHYRGAYSDSFLDGDVLSDRQAVWTERLATGADTETILAEAGERLVGFVHVIFDADPEHGSLVDNLHVTYERKRRGVGSRLMSEAARTVNGREPGGLYLWVLEQNAAAQAFYKARGGVVSGRRAVPSPGGVQGRLAGTPFGLRYSWPDPTVLLSSP